MTFQESPRFKQGKTTEGVVAKWLRCNGWTVFPSFEAPQEPNKGPRLYTPSGELVMPDLFARKGNDIRLIEVKDKSVFSYHRISNKLCTGIDFYLYKNYLRVQSETPWPVWLLFLHHKGKININGNLYDSPTGLFGGDLSYLKDNYSHAHENGSKNGMIYWAKDKLNLYAPIEELCVIGAP